jgi:DNA excision repair protein ERCC-3
MLTHRRVNSGLYLAFEDKLAVDFDLQVIDKRQSLLLTNFVANEKDRPYQIEAIHALRSTNAGGLLLCATQTGKTRIAARYLSNINENVLFLVHELTLLLQARETLQQVTGERIGVIGGGEFSHERITVATVQTLIRQIAKPKPAFVKLFQATQVVLIDEIHLMMNDSTEKIIQACQPKAVFGLTASLDLDKPEIALPAYALTGPVLYKYEIKQGVKEGYLTPGVIVCLKMTKLVNIDDETSEEAYQRIVVNNRKRTEAIVALVKEGARRNHRVVVFVRHHAHLRQIVSACRYEKITCEPLSGYTEKYERLRLRDEFEAGRLPVLVVTSVFSHGIVLSSLTVTIDATAMRSSHFAVQRYGRGAGAVEGKSGKIHFDLSDSTGTYQGSATARKKTLRRLGANVLLTKWEKVKNVARLYDVAEGRLLK